MSLVSLVEWNVSLGSADVSWRGGVPAVTTATKETRFIRLIKVCRMFRACSHYSSYCLDVGHLRKRFLISVPSSIDHLHKYTSFSANDVIFSHKRNWKIIKKAS